MRVSSMMQRIERQRRRRTAVELVDAGLSQAEVARQLSVSREAVRKWCIAYREGGPAALVSRPSPGAPPKLPPARLADLPVALQRGARAYGFEGDRWTLRRITEYIQRAYGVSYHPSHVRRLLRRLHGRGPVTAPSTGPSLLRTASPSR